MKSAIISIILFVCFSSYGQTYLNLDFETNIYKTLNPKKWFVSGSGYEFSLDSIHKYSGKFGFKIENKENIDGSIGKVIGNLPIGFARTNNITLTAKVKRDVAATNSPGIFISVEDEKGNVIDKKVSFLNDIAMTSEWTQVLVELHIPVHAKKVYLGGTFIGKGRSWFDNFEIFIDNRKYEEEIPLTTTPNAGEMEWLKTSSIPLISTNPEEANWFDLVAFKNILKGVKIIGLGEVTHGSKEIFEMKHRLIRYLTKTEGFNIFSIEANMPEAYEINRFVLNNEGDSQSLIGGMGFWTWYTQEILDMVTWMNEQNSISESKIVFTGFDMQSHKGPIKVLKANSNKKINLLLEKMETSIDSAKASSRRGLNLLAYYSKDLNFLKDWYTDKFRNSSKKDWMLQNIRILEQATNNYHFSLRDKYMGENVNWIVNQNPNSKLILWGHNGHIMSSGKAMGKHLSDKYGSGYLSVGFAFHEGEYTAKGESGVNSYPAQNSEPGTYEFFFNSIDEPIFFLDLRNLDENDPNQKWLLRPMRFRQTGALKVDEEFYLSNITEDFDIIIFVSKSSATNLLQKTN